MMFIGKTLPFVKTFVDELDRALKRQAPDAGLTRIQKEWIGFCLVAILVTNSVCWKRFERASLGARSARSLSWMFRKTNRFWQFLLSASVRGILHTYAITEGVLVVDDSEKKRAKQTTRIDKAHKVKDKKSGGFINGQSVVLLLFVTRTVTIPVGVEFYMPDPTLTAWNKEERRLKARGVSKKNRPAKPKKDPKYPTIPEIALQLLKAFHAAFPEVVIHCVLADNLYGTDVFLEQASAIFGGVQVISTLKKSQNLRFQGKKMKVTTWLSRYPGVKQTIRIRGGEDVTVWVSSARVHQDWKAYEGWGQLTKQPDEDGSRRSVILSLLCDHCLLLHPDQLARIQDQRPACTVGSLRDRVRMDSSLRMFEEILLSQHPQKQFELVAQRAKEFFPLNESSKHMVGRELGRLESTPSLEYRAKSVLKTA